MAKNSTSFNKDNQPGDRAPRGKGKKSLMLEAIKDVCGDEHKFLKQVVVIGLGGWTKPEPAEDEEEPEEPAEPIFQQPNPMLLNMVLNRIDPPLKSISPLVQFNFSRDAKPHEQASEVLDAMATGKIPSDIGNVFIQSIRSMIDIEEYTDLKERIETIEKALGVISND